MLRVSRAGSVLVSRRWLASVRSASGASFDVVSPVDGTTVVSTVRADDDVSVAMKFVSASQAQKNGVWSSIRWEDRAARIRDFAERVRDDAGEIASIITAETGKPATQSRMEVNASARRVTDLVAMCDRARARMESNSVRASSSSVTEKVTHEPVGVVAHVSAWNYPAFLAVNVLVPALLAGNSVLHKPSELSPGVSERLRTLLLQSDVPSEVFQVCQGGADVGTALVRLQGLGAVAFTGSRVVGTEVATVAARSHTRTVLELGGVDAAYVRPNVADVARAAASIASGAFHNAGQGCCAVERVYVHRDVYDSFVDAFVAEARKYRAADPALATTNLGPLTSRGAVERVAAHVDDAVRAGAHVLYRGEAPTQGGGYFHPVVVVGGDALRGSQRQRMITADETFGPVAAVVPVHDDEEAIEAMNDSSYGLTASVYTSDGAVAESILRRLDVGTGYWNACNHPSTNLPWTGRYGSGGGSGGCTLGEEGYASFTRPKALYMRSRA